MKYAILTRQNPNEEIAHHDAVGFYQWLNVFPGQLIQVEDDFNHLQDGAYDLIQIRLCRENLPLVPKLREQLGAHSVTKIALCLDIPEPDWKKEFSDPFSLKEAVGKADFVFATTFAMARALEDGSGKKVYEIPHPADLEKIKPYQKGTPGAMATILNGRPKNVLRSIRRIRKAFGAGAPIRVLAYGFENPGDPEFYRNLKIDFANCKNEVDLCRRMAESQFILIPESGSSGADERPDYEKLTVYAAALGVIVLGDNHLEAMRRCYSEMANASSSDLVSVYKWIKNNPDLLRYILETAQVKAEFYSWGNLRKRFLDWLYEETKDERFRYGKLSAGPPSLFQQIHHIYGPQRIDYHPEEFVAICLVKNGTEYLRTFMDHYRRLGAKHLFFIDNGSTDGTVAALQQYPNITIYQTDLPHKKYECEIRRAVIEEHCRNHWCLNVDIDELFDYPGSGRISTREFLRYLNSHHYTAVLAYLLDMFSRELEFPAEGAEIPAPPEPDLASKYCYYDISVVQKNRYTSSFIAFSNYNRLADPRMRNYSGGIRRSFFKCKESGYLLTKHPLIFVDSKIEPVVHPHYCNKAVVADVNGVLKHYKFITTFKDKVLRSLESKDFCYWGQQEYQEYLNVIKDKNKLSLYSRESQKLENVEQLIRQGFLRQSKAFGAYIKGAAL